jgi:hypothetical protein
MTTVISSSGWATTGFPSATPALEGLGLKFSAGGAHISRTMMLSELEAVLSAVPAGANPGEYRDAILQRNVLGKTTESTRQKSLRHLRELYALDEASSIFGVMRKLHSLDSASLPLIALQVAWARDPLFRSTTNPILEASEGERIETVALVRAVETSFPGQYSEKSCNSIARRAASSWTQSGHLVGRTNKIRAQVKPTNLAVALALFLGNVAGFHGAAVFSNPWCRLLDLNADESRHRAFEAHRAGLLDLRAVGEVVEISFPLLSKYQLDHP